jgi:hypothetical protein
MTKNFCLLLVTDRHYHLGFNLESESPDTWTEFCRDSPSGTRVHIVFGRLFDFC